MIHFQAASTAIAADWMIAAKRTAAWITLRTHARLAQFRLVRIDAHAAAVDGRNRQRPQLEIHLSARPDWR